MPSQRRHPRLRPTKANFNVDSRNKEKLGDEFEKFKKKGQKGGEVLSRSSSVDRSPGKTGEGGKDWGLGYCLCAGRQVKAAVLAGRV